MNSQTLLTILLMFVVLGVGFIMGRMTATPGAAFTSNSSLEENVMSESESPSQETTPASASVSEQGTTVDSSKMTEGQRKLVSAMGLDPDNITITAAMVTCAEGKLGAPRVQEIMNGATPSMMEGASLVVCYNQ